MARITTQELNNSLNSLESALAVQTKALEQLCKSVNALAAAQSKPAQSPAKQAVKPAKQVVKPSAKASVKDAKQKKAEAPAVVNYGTWNGYCEARRKAAGFGDKWVSKAEFYAKLDELGWEATHSYRGRFYHHGSPKKSDR